MKKIIYVLISSLLFLLAGCDKNPELKSLPVVGGDMLISFQNEQGEDLLNGIELKYIADDNDPKYNNTNVLAFNIYKINSWINLDSDRQDLNKQKFNIKYLVFKESNEMKRLIFDYSFTLYPYNIGNAVYEFSCPHIFGDEEIHKINISFKDYIKEIHKDIELIDCEIDGKKGTIIDQENTHILFKIKK